MKTKAIASLILLILAGCASAPNIQYFTLDMTPANEATSSPHIVVEDLRVAEAVTRKDIMIKTSPTEVEYYATAQWAASLGELVTDKLREEFGDASGAGRTLLLKGRLMAFEQVDVTGGAEAHMKLAVTLQDAVKRTKPPLLERTYDVVTPADSATPGAVVRALSKCVEKVAAEIMADAAGR